MSRDFEDMFGGRTAWTARVADEPADTGPRGGEATVGSGPYKPYGYTPADDLETCEIAWWLPDGSIQGQAIQYRFLVRLQYLADTHLQLMLTDAVICLEGRNLTDLRKRLARRRVTFIQAYNAHIWPTPPESDPMVEKVTVLYPGEDRFGTTRQ